MFSIFSAVGQKHQKHLPTYTYVFEAWGVADPNSIFKFEIFQNPPESSLHFRLKPTTGRGV